MSTEVRTPDVTRALPPVLRGLAASEASRPVYLPVSVLLSQKAPVAPAVAVTAQQQTPVVMASQAHVQAASQPVQPPQSGIAATPGAPVVSQVRVSSSPFLPPCVAHARPQGHGLCHSCQQAGCVISTTPGTRGLTSLHSWTCVQSLTHAHTHSRSCIHTSV